MSAKLLKKFKDRQVLEQLKKKDKDAFIKVYDEYAEDIYRFIYFKVAKETDAQDLSSLVFLKAWHHIQANTLVDSKTLRALVYKIARNAVIDHYREASVKLELSLDDDNNPIEIVDDSQDLATKLDRANDLALLKKQLPLLKEEYREIIVLRFVSDLSLEEIADVTAKSRGNVRVILHRALAALKGMVEEEMAKKTNFKDKKN
ncbi:MAG: sigma-70 family RNA polymerase sigma factor [Clostridia bacterium]|nr:sigma-70 family RNA polymerase sigma factor [Clostridia bacterium]